MNHCFRGILISLMLVILVSVARAEVNLDITGQVRARHETTRKSFDADDATRDFSDLRTRLMVDATVKDNVHAVVQFQDSRRFGTNSASGTLANTANVDVHQAYLSIEALWPDGPGLRAGRFEVNLGNQRVFGSVGWHNVGRSWEGFQAWYDDPVVRADGYWLKRREANDPYHNRDFDIVGTNVRIKKANVELFTFHENNAGFSGFYPDQNRLNRTSLGGYFDRVYNEFDFIANAVLQFGTQNIVGSPSTEQDIAAVLWTFEGGYTFPGAAKARLAAGIDYASGDDREDPDEFTAYNNLYYTGHKFRGYMDYFISSDPAGLVDLMLRGSMIPHQGWVLKGDLHLFSTAENYIDFRGDETNDVGAELDLTATTDNVPGVKLTGGASAFFPKDSFAGMDDPDPAFWFYLMGTADF